MKKILILLCFSLAMFSKNASAQQSDTSATKHQMKFYYYPSLNIYYDPTAEDYWYYDESNSNWTSVKQLPSSVTLVRSPRYLVYHNDADIWKDNAEHLKKFKVKKNGEIKTKPAKS